MSADARISPAEAAAGSNTTAANTTSGLRMSLSS
jgi:hypothetical protein